MLACSPVAKLLCDGYRPTIHVLLLLLLLLLLHLVFSFRSDECSFPRYFPTALARSTLMKSVVSVCLFVSTLSFEYTDLWSRFLYVYGP